jgi:Passenger-associated-transport-repeat
MKAKIFQTHCFLAAALASTLLFTSAFGTTMVTNWGGGVANSTSGGSSSGNYSWTCPSGVTSVQVEVWGGGGQGGNIQMNRTTGSYTGDTGGGGGGAYAKKNSMPVTAGQTYTIVIPAAANNTSDMVNGNHHDGSAVAFTNLVTDSGGQIYVLAGGGTGGTNYNGNTSGATSGGGPGSSTTSGADASHNGGTGATSTSSGGGGGGGGAGDNGDGNAGGSPSVTSGGGGGTGTIQAGGAGGTGAATTANGGVGSQTAPGAGGGGARVTAGASNPNGKTYGGAGGLGMIKLTYIDPNVGSSSTNAFLTGLVLSPAGTLSPAFATNTLTYSANEATFVMPTVTVTNSDLTASNALIVNGSFVQALTSGVPSSSLTLSAGATTPVTVRVTAQDGITVNIYTVNVTAPSGSPYYWDGNDNTAGFGTATGTWAAPTVGTTTNGWSTNAAGTTTVNGNSITTGTGDKLYFGTTNDTLATGTITVSGTVNAGTLNFPKTTADITFGGAGTINLATNATINLCAGANITSPFLVGPEAVQVNGAVFSGAGTSLLITNGGRIQFRSGTAGWGAGATATIAGDSQVYLYSGNGALGLGGASGYTIQLGDAVTGGSLYTGNSVTIPNNVVAASGSGFRFISLYNNGTTPAFSGNLTTHTNCYIVYGGTTGGKTATVSGTNNSIDSGATVTLCMGAATAGVLNDNAIWKGSGKVEYTSAAMTNVSPAFTNVPASSSAALYIQNWNSTYSGGAYVHDFTNGSVLVVYPGATNAVPTNGVFGVGTLTLGDGAALRAGTWQNPTAIPNPVTIAGNVTFPTVASEYSLWFTNAVNLGSATRTITCNVGATVSTEMVDFQGVISGTGSAGIIMAGTGTLRLSGANNYTGNTTVSSGTLAIAQPYLAAGSTLSVSNGAVLNLEFSTTNVVAGFITNGVSVANGIYNSVNAAPFITGTGSLQVGTLGPDLSQNHLTNSVTGGGTTLSLSWSPGWKLQAQTNSLSTGLGTNWVYITDGTANSTNLPIVPGNPSVFYRLVNQ